MRFTSAVFAMIVGPLLSVWSVGSKIDDTSPTWNKFVDDFIENYFAFHPEDGIDAGRHEFDGKLPEWSKESLKREAEWYHAQYNAALSFDEASLSTPQRFERDYVVAVIEGKLFWLEEADWPFKNPQFYSSALDPDIYISRKYAPLEERMQAYINYSKGIPKAVDQIKKNLRTPLPRPYVDRGSRFFGGLVGASFDSTNGAA